MDRKENENLDRILKYLKESEIGFVFPDEIRKNLDLLYPDYRIVFYSQFPTYIKKLIDDGYVEKSKITDEVRITIEGLKFIQRGGFVPTVFQKIKKLISKGENVKWIIGIILILIGLAITVLLNLQKIKEILNCL